jgi:hypothetical protein
MVGRMERRQATRHAQKLDVEVHSKTERVPLQALDVSRHGLFVMTAKPAPLHHAVLLTVHLRGGPFETMATVARRQVEHGAGSLGMGLKLFCLGAQAKSRWDQFVASLDAPGLNLPVRGVDPTGNGAVFLVQPDDVAALYEFFISNVMGSRTLYLSPAIRAIGAPVHVVLVHPITHDEMTLFATVVEWNADHPLRMGIRFDNLDGETRRAFKGFLGPVPGVGTLSMPDSAPLLTQDRVPWTEYAYYSPRVRANRSEVSGEIVLLEEEVPQLAPPSSDELDVIEGQLLEHPELEMVDARALFDFHWNNDDEKTKP